jgi:DNA polymerase I-like protein with 3'-5' exonuclease and polymerase domains
MMTLQSTAPSPGIPPHELFEKVQRSFVTDLTRGTIDYAELNLLRERGVTVVNLTPFSKAKFIKNFKEWMMGLTTVVGDIETPHWDEKLMGGRIHLASWFDGTRVITVDHHAIDPSELYDNEMFKKVCVVAHNVKFEAHWFMEHGIEFPNVHCTLLSEQKLLMGADLFHNLVDALQRRGIPAALNKDVRMEFTDPLYRHKHYHIVYNQDDVIPLLLLKAKQDALIDQYGLGFYIRRIHFPLIRTLVKMERVGLTVDEIKFRKLADEAEAIMKGIEQKLNEWLTQTFPGKDFQQLNKPVWDRTQQLKDMLSRVDIRYQKTKLLISNYQSLGKTHLKAYKTACESLVKIQEDESRMSKELTDLEAQKTISWTSTHQVLAVLNALGCIPMPQAKDKKTRKLKPSLSRAARERWLLNNQTHPLRFIIQQYDKYMDQVKHVSTFGHTFLEKYKHPVTGKYHTSYKQGTVATGRLASGDSDSTPPTFNSQQIPGVTELRECFGTDPGYMIETCDLSGAELVTMCSLANDLKLLALNKAGDMHSYFANKGWKAIYTYRGKEWTASDTISKKQNSDKRQDYKPMLFGTVYGLFPLKAGEILNISEKEGAIVINTIIEEIPDTIAMVQEAVAFALKNGYIIHNTRTNSRRWFPAVLYALKTDTELEYMDRAEVTGAARNTRIQGTQADMLCEAMVTLQRYIDRWKLDACILMQVHDEIVVRFKEEYKDWFPQRVKDIMTRVANKYLRPGITMGADYHVKYTWYKPK